MLLTCECATHTSIAGRRGYALVPGITEGRICTVIALYVSILLNKDMKREPNMGGGGGRGRERESCLLYTSPSPRDLSTSRMPSSA